MSARLSRLYNQRRGGPALGPRKATGPFVRSKVKDTVQRRAVTWPLLWSSWPGAAKRGTGDGELDRDGKSAPPASGPAGGCCGGCAESP